MTKKVKILDYSLIVMGILILLTYSCKKDDDNNDSGGTVTDIDGNIYHTVNIGNQMWMVENLKVTIYRNGDSIPNVNDNEQWRTLTTGAYCYYDNDVANADIYGLLYNWHIVNDSRNI